MKPILQFENVSKIYSTGVTALQDVSFSIYEGEFVFLVGPSGAGKSTITKLAILEEKPTHGEIVFEQFNASRARNGQLHKLRRDIGVVFQNFRLLQNMTVEENMGFVLEAMGLPDKEIKDQVEYTLNLVGLETKGASFPWQLSGGEQQRATIARAVVSQPKLLIADEPTGNLDEENSWDVIQLLNKINSWGTTLIVATHNKQVVDSLQRRVLALKDGRLVRDSSGGYSTSKTDGKKVKPAKTVVADKELVEVQAPETPAEPASEAIKEKAVEKEEKKEKKPGDKLEEIKIKVNKGKS